MNTPLNPLPDLDTVRREIQSFLRTAPAHLDGVPVAVLLSTQIRRNTDDVTLALAAFGQEEYARLTTQPGRAAAQIFQHAAYALTAFNEQLDPYPLAAALFAAQWSEERAQPLVNLIPPPDLDTLSQALPDVVWQGLTPTLTACTAQEVAQLAAWGMVKGLLPLTVCTAQEAAQLAAWGMVKGLLLNAVSEQLEDGEREEALSTMLRSLEENGAKH